MIPLRCITSCTLIHSGFGFIGTFILDLLAFQIIFNGLEIIFSIEMIDSSKQEQVLQ
jgi:hypothetical protein